MTYYGILDFSYAPYALGDAMTFVTNVQSKATMGGHEDVQLLILSLPDNPSSPLQRRINTSNFHHSISGLYPAFLSGSMISRISIFQNYKSFNHALYLAKQDAGEFWPSLTKHYQKSLNYWSHKPINDCYEHKGYFPKLMPSLSYVGVASRFLSQQTNFKHFVSVNIRQRALTDDPAALHRDSNPTVWYDFLLRMSVDSPEIGFIMVGGFNEWHREFASLNNVIIPRLFGMGLGHEIAMVLTSKMFMGTNSGFANVATFGGVPHVITSIEPAHARHAEIEIGATKHPFNDDRQRLYWGEETPDNLWAWYKEIWCSL